MNSLKQRIHSLRFRFTMIIVLVLMLVIGSLLFVNATYLETYTIHRKTNRIEDTVTLIREYVDSGYSEESQLRLEQSIRRSTLDVIVLRNLDTIPQVLFASDLNENGNGTKMIEYFMGKLPVPTEIYKDGGDHIIYRSYDERLHSYQIDCIGVLQGNIGFILTTPLESIRETVELSSRFLLFLGAIAILVGAVIMYVVTLRMTKPILRLSDLSAEMAELNFDAHYEGHSGDEIQVLGENMNRMSDRLEQTIGDLRAANVQLEKDLREKERIDERRRLFLSNVSHELKTPLALIQGYAEGLQEGIDEDPESRAFYCEVIMDEARKMNTIVRRLLDLDAIETGNVVQDPEVFDLAELLRDVANSTRPLAEGKDCELDLQLDSPIPVYEDQFMIEQVVQNYMSNAFHYVCDGGTVSVQTEYDGDRVRVYVMNTGDPIPEADLDQIWDKFYKVDKARTRSYGGSGIGLSIVKAILDGIHCSYGADNLRDGVVFWFDLPLYHGEAEVVSEDQ